jgi:hypothetical protein
LSAATSAPAAWARGRDCFDVDDAQQRIARRFQHDESRLAGQGLFQLCVVGLVDERYLEGAAGGE